MSETKRQITRRIVMRSARVMNEKNIGLIAAGMAFYAILAVFPGIATVISLWGLLGDPGIALEQLESYEQIFPDQVHALIRGQLLTLSRADGLTLGWTSLFSFAFAFYTAQNGVLALMRGLNTIYDAPNRTGISHYLRAFLLMISLIAVALVALGCVVVAPIVLAFFPLGALAGTAVQLVNWSVALVVLLAGFGVIYRLGPNVPDQRFRLVRPGAVFAAVVWTIASAGFSIYLANFGRYNEIYGSIGAVMAMLMWLYISAWLVLLGGALNARLENRLRRGPEASPKP